MCRNKLTESIKCLSGKLWKSTDLLQVIWLMGNCRIAETMSVVSEIDVLVVFVTIVGKVTARNVK